MRRRDWLNICTQELVETKIVSQINANPSYLIIKHTQIRKWMSSRIVSY